MNNYQKLTKIIKDEHGNEQVACVYFGTESAESYIRTAVVLPAR